MCVSLKTIQGLPDGSVVQNPLANAEDMGSIPGPERSHMPRLLILCSRTWELQRLSPLAATTGALESLSLCSVPREAATVRSQRPQLESISSSLQLEKSLCSKEEPAQPKKTN